MQFRKTHKSRKTADCSGMTHTLRCVLEWPPCPCPGEEVPPQPGILIRGPTASNPGLDSSHKSTHHEPWPTFPNASMYFVLKASQSGRRPGRPWVVVGESSSFSRPPGDAVRTALGVATLQRENRSSCNIRDLGALDLRPSPKPPFKKQDGF